MKKLLIILPLLMFSISAQASRCDRHPIYCRILEVKPSVNRSFAMELSNYIYKYSKKFGTDPMLSVAIAMQESSMINKDRPGSILDPKTNKVIRGYTDIGVFQLHIDTISNYRKELGWNIDLRRLRNDVEYQTYWHVRTLKRKINICSQERVRQEREIESGNEWSCYNSANTWLKKDGRIVRDKNGKKVPGPRLEYLRLVSRYLPDSYRQTASIPKSL